MKDDSDGVSCYTVIWLGQSILDFSGRAYRLGEKNLTKIFET